MDREKERFIVLSFVLVITTLFVVFLGPVITGNVVKDVEDVTLADFPYPFIKNHRLNSVVVVVADDPSPDELLAAHELALLFEHLLGVKPAVKTQSAVVEGEYNRIIVGKCGEALVQDVLGEECVLEQGVGQIKVVPKQYALDLVVTGADAQGVRLAATLLIMYKAYELSGDEVIVEGERDAPYRLFLR